MGNCCSCKSCRDAKTASGNDDATSSDSDESVDNDEDDEQEDLRETRADKKFFDKLDPGLEIKVGEKLVTDKAYIGDRRGKCQCPKKFKRKQSSGQRPPLSREDTLYNKYMQIIRQAKERTFSRWKRWGICRRSEFGATH